MTEEPYTIGIRLALEDGVSAGVVAMKEQMSELERAVAASLSGMSALRSAAGGAEGMLPPLRSGVPETRLTEGDADALSAWGADQGQGVRPKARLDDPPTSPFVGFGEIGAVLPEYALSLARETTSPVEVGRTERAEGADRHLVERAAPSMISLAFPAMLPGRPITEEPGQAGDAEDRLSRALFPMAPASAPGEDFKPAQYADWAPGGGRSGLGYSYSVQAGTPTEDDGRTAVEAEAPASSLAPSAAPGAACPEQPSQMMPDGPAAHMSGALGGDVYLDGERIGRWISDRLARDACRPPSGAAAFDPMISPAW